MFGEQNKSMLKIAVNLAVIFVVIFLIVIFFFGNKNNTGSTGTPSKTTAGKNASKDLVPIVVLDSIVRSADAGESFEKYFKVATSSKIGNADVLSIVFHPLIRDRVFVTTYQDGIFLNEKRVNSWTKIDFPPKKIYSFILDNSSPDNRIFASGVVEENGRIFRTDDGGNKWRVVYAEPGLNSLVSALAQYPKNPKLIIAGTSMGTIVKSFDRGDTWKNVGQKIDGRISNFDFDSTKQFTYMLSYQSKIYFSTDEGSTWKNWEDEKAKEVAALNSQANALAGKQDSAGADALRKQAAALQKRNNENRQPGGVINIVTDPTKSGIIYAGTTNGLYRSKDYGKYWNKLNIIESAEKFPIKSVAISPKNSNEIVFVSGRSFYKSINNGDTWAVVPVNNSINAVFVAYDPFDPKIIFIGLSRI
ncbi:hypothetical protein A2662_00420 [Candidatus Giovannonibacteria bacterium RIFCSPHIGHO2_01_FULL_45_33]|uniref:Photosynthesis system II assembly factor Ycf48/Hcf136-like domain-containing protein n=1 Tax=Candidatus Giovannonibacteria bacterium RIFCSPLOWO2_01_FULL_45_34 TaxID=1798351 RepID=A0A1F5WY94_9BACT|nr:MAG: hypothetical protein A2662_00420 [Candidatus Giovannonibacteria bacterium RIFCSPHIGHO2_01_FULL_45_33]OGF70653.1 MAG: hypothetical protein A3C73_02120 [Candidatus Giovannonibacteria bacterium RIFCSPHIGHO2_02_FULL_44_11]OGF80614.1 MAG: hypothetical protein A2930_02940 [Candidatus Giovannonibacteria bacterium RIFCSPLOWO2_01_FULL_45_34]